MARLWRRQGVHCRIRGEQWEPVGGRPRWAGAHEALRGARWWIAELFSRTMPGGDSERMLHADLLASMVFGEGVREMEPETRELFRRTGTVHLLVVSGAQ